MENTASDYYGRESIGRILLRIAPPVMIGQLIQSLYNIVDSFFIGKYSSDALTALTVIYPLQLIIIALAVGTGVGVNTYMARKYAHNSPQDADDAAGTGMVLELLSWAVLAVLAVVFMRPYVMTSATSEAAIDYAVTYGNIVSIGSIGVFLEGNWTKVHQAKGNMRRPMAALILGAVLNIILDPILIFGAGMGIAGAAAATVAGQVLAAVITAFGAVKKPPKFKKMLHFIKRIYFFGYSSIFMQALYTVYILALNIILAGFSDAAVTVLGLYYKLQGFFFIPLFGLQTCIVPVLSYNYAAANYSRCKQTMNFTYLISGAFMVLGIIGFVLFPTQLINLFSDDALVHEIGKTAFPIIGSGFISAVFGLVMPTFFQAIGMGIKSTFLSLLRQIFCLVPIFWAFSLIGLNYTWLSFPISETISGGVGLIMYAVQLKKWKGRAALKSSTNAVIKPSHSGVIITVAREHGSSGKQIGKLVAKRPEIPFYYKEMTALAAQESGLDKEFISELNANSPTLLHDLYLSTHVVQQAVAAQAKIIKKIAESGSCVIVGRSADYVLRDRPDVLRVFIYADNDVKIRRISEEYGDDPQTAERNMRRADSARAAYYRNISGKTWGDRQNYDLMINSSDGVEKCADIICEYAKKR
ncbi:MAG: MATE family efflux transporter [Oscillospiraceae bacterium]|nr:MATE family efflux transporter [Oscillospiraceae bacterium]